MTYAVTPRTNEPKMIQRTTVVSSDVGDPFVLTSAKPPPMTRAPNATTKKNSATLRGTLQKKRDWDRSGRRDPFAAAASSADIRTLPV